MTWRTSALVRNDGRTSCISNTSALLASGSFSNLAVIKSWQDVVAKMIAKTAYDLGSPISLPSVDEIAIEGGGWMPTVTILTHDPMFRDGKIRISKCNPEGLAPAELHSAARQIARHLVAIEMREAELRAMLTQVLDRAKHLADATSTVVVRRVEIEEVNFQHGYNGRNGRTIVRAYLNVRYAVRGDAGRLVEDHCPIFCNLGHKPETQILERRIARIEQGQRPILAVGALAGL